MDDRLAGLSPRQLQCLRLVARGLEAKEIGRSLGISDLTVENHLSATRIALGVARSIDAARLADAYDRALGTVPDATGTSGTSAPPGITELIYSDIQLAGQSGTSDDIDGLRDGVCDPLSHGAIAAVSDVKGQRNDLGIAARLAIVVGLIVLLIAAVGFFVETSGGLKF